jgi:hypothetical protein
MRPRPVSIIALAAVLAAACATTGRPRADPLDDDDDVMSCWTGGEILFRETTHGIGAAAVPPDVLVIHDSGAWSLEGRRTGSGCLAGDEVEQLRDRLTVVRRVPPDAVTCAALATHTTLIEVPGTGSLSFDAPCGLGPDTATAAGIACAHDLTWRRNAAQVCTPSP